MAERKKRKKKRSQIESTKLGNGSKYKYVSYL